MNLIEGLLLGVGLVVPAALLLAEIDRRLAVGIRERLTPHDADVGRTYREGIAAGMRFVDHREDVDCPYRHGSFAAHCWRTGKLDTLRMARDSGADVARRSAVWMGADVPAVSPLEVHLAEQSGEVPPEGVYLIDPEPTPPTEEERAWVLDALARSRTCPHCPDPSTCGGCDPDLDGDAP